MTASRLSYYVLLARYILVMIPGYFILAGDSPHLGLGAEEGGNGKQASANNSFFVASEEKNLRHIPIAIPPSRRVVLGQSLDPTKNIAHYIHRHWSTEDGMPQNSAQAICQTRDGYLWIGTEEGLVRFDGVQFTVFDAAHMPGLRANTIQALLEDREGTLWIGTMGGGLSAYKNGVFTSYTTHDGLAHDFISSLQEDRTETLGTALWIGTLGGGVSRFHQGRFTTLSTANGLTHNLVFSLLQDRQGALWIGTNGGGVNRYYRGELTSLTTANGLSNNLVRSLCEDSQGAVWIGTFGGGLNRYNNGIITHFGKAEGLGHNLVWSLTEDRRGALWIGTFGGGLYRFYRGVFSSFSTKNGLSSDLVRSVMEDHEGSLWVGTVGGLNRFTDGKFTTFTTADGMTHDVVRALTEHSAGGIWIGTFGGGVNLLAAPRHIDNRSPDAGRGIAQVLTTAQGLSNNIVYSLLEERPKRHDDSSSINRLLSSSSGRTLWIGTNGGGVNRWSSGTFTHFSTANGLLHDVVFCMMQDHQGAVWIGTMGGVSRYENGLFTHITTKNGLSNDNIRVLLEDRQGAVWIGTFGGGLHRYYHGQIRCFTTQDGLSGDNIRALYEDESGALWIGTVGSGLNRYYKGKFSPCTTANGLFNDVIHCIVDDGCGYLWMSCNKGIFRVRKQELNEFADGKRLRVHCDVFGKSDGMINAECNSGSPSGAKDSEGNLWFATMTGAVTVNPRSQQLATNPLEAIVILESANADSIQMDMSSSERLIDAGAQKFEFHYTATGLVSPERAIFRYKLEGYDDDWVEAGKRRVAYYTNLPHGRTYCFRVQVQSDHEEWQTEGASALFRLHAYFWETWWFYCLCFAGLVSLSALAYRVHMRRLYQKAKWLEEIVAVRTLELRQSNEEIQHHLEELDKQAHEIECSNVELREKNIQLEALHKEKDEFLGIAVHDLKNPLTSIGLAAALIRRYGTVPDALPLILEQADRIGMLTERMTGIISNFLDLNALESGTMTFHLHSFDIISIIYDVLEEYRTKSSMKAINILCEPSRTRQCFVQADKQVVEEIFDNLLSNALKFSPPGTTVRVRVVCSALDDEQINSAENIHLKRHREIVRLEVQDEGPGISDDDKKKLFGKFTRLSARPTDGEQSTGLGLSIVKKLSEAIGGRVWCESEFGYGATFIVELPAGEIIEEVSDNKNLDDKHNTPHADAALDNTQ